MEEGTQQLLHSRKYNRNHYYGAPPPTSYSSFNTLENEEDYRESFDRDCAQISRISYIDVMEDPAGDAIPEHDWWIFYNVHKRVYFRAPTHKNDAKEGVVIKWKFSNCVSTCHQANPSTTSARSLEVLLGFSNGSVFLFSPFDERVKTIREKRVFNRRDSKERVTTSKCTDVKWVPKNIPSPYKAQMRYSDKYLHCFVSAHSNGHLYVYDRRISEDNEGPFSPLVSREMHQKTGNESFSSDAASALAATKHVFSVRCGRCTKNPVEMWHVSQSVINGIAFCSTGKFLATVQEDGTLQVFDFFQKRLVVVFRSYYGGLNCLCWSADDKFILTGGEDDLITLWNPHNQTVVARGNGHQSFVSSVSFQPDIQKKSHQRYYDGFSTGGSEYLVYSFVSVGQDGNVIFWKYEDVPSKSEHDDKTSEYSNLGTDTTLPIEVDSPSRKDILMLRPEFSSTVHDGPISSVLIAKNLLMTLSDRFQLRIWSKPVPTH